MQGKVWLFVSQAGNHHTALTLYQLVHPFLFCLKLVFELLGCGHDIDQIFVAPSFSFPPVLGEASDSVHLDKKGQTHPGQSVETIHSPTRVRQSDIVRDDGTMGVSTRVLAVRLRSRKDSRVDIQALRDTGDSQS